jgi:hypothetical protein
MKPDGKLIGGAYPTERNVELSGLFKRFIEGKFGGDVTIDAQMAERQISISFHLRSGASGRRDFPLDRGEPLAQALLAAFAAIEHDVARCVGVRESKAEMLSRHSNVVSLDQARLDRLRRAVDPMYRQLASDLAARLDHLADQIESLSKCDPQAAELLATRVQELVDSADRAAISLRDGLKAD